MTPNAMTADIQQLLYAYHVWLREKTVVRQIDEWTEITTPFLDRHNDCIQIYARRDGDRYILTDDGYTVADLEQSGCKLQSAKRQDLLKMTLNGFGVRLEGNAIEVHASAENFSLRKHNLVQAMLAVNDMFFLAAPVITSLFYEDVVAWLDANEIRYTPKVKFTGKTGFDHVFDFVIPKSKTQPERILQAINRPSRETAQSIVLSWIDTKEVRAQDSRVYALLNDEQQVQAGVLDALHSYEVRTVVWSDREAVVADLAA